MEKSSCFELFYAKNRLEYQSIFFIIPCTFRHISQRHGIFKHALGRIIWQIDDFMDAPADEIILKNTG